MGRERRWRWPWAALGLAATGLAFLFLSLAAIFLEDLAVRQGWLAGALPRDAFPLDPARPLSAVDSVLVSLPFLLAPLFALWAVHGVSWRRAFAWSGSFDWRQFWRAAAAYLVLGALGVAFGYLLEPQQHQFPPRGASFLAWIALALAVVFVQTLGEDALFKGYLVRVCGAVLPLRVPVVAAVIGCFVAGHLWNEDFGRDFAVNLIYFTVAEILSFAMLFRTQNLAASAGMHWMNNVLATLAPTLPGQPVYLALVIYTDPVYAAGGGRLLDPLTHAVGILGLGLLLVLLLWRRSPFYLPKAPLPRPGAAIATPPEAGVARHS
jgi:membrane protease YdiL (CAAX protease family)